MDHLLAFQYGLVIPSLPHQLQHSDRTLIGNQATLYLIIGQDESEVSFHEIAQVVMGLDRRAQGLLAWSPADGVDPIVVVLVEQEDQD